MANWLNEPKSMDQAQPAIVRVDEHGIGYTKGGQGYVRAFAGPGAVQNGPYSVIVSYTVPVDANKK